MLRFLVASMLIGKNEACRNSMINTNPQPGLHQAKNAREKSQRKNVELGKEILCAADNEKRKIQTSGRNTASFRVRSSHFGCRYGPDDDELVSR
jgi:hypothetical protein